MSSDNGDRGAVSRMTDKKTKNREKISEKHAYLGFYLYFCHGLAVIPRLLSQLFE